jgi:hypothetical protein
MDKYQIALDMTHNTMKERRYICLYGTLSMATFWGIMGNWVSFRGRIVH